MSALDLVHLAAGVLATLAAVLAMSRIRTGPALLDRVVANDVLTASAVALSAVLIVWWRRDDLALLLLLLALTGFITSVVAARFVTREVVGERRILSRLEAEQQQRLREAEALVDEIAEAEDAEEAAARGEGEQS